MAYREGFEPSQAELEAAVLPLTLPIHKMVLPLGFEPRSSPHLEASPGYKPGALPLSYGSKIKSKNILFFGKICKYVKSNYHRFLR